MFSLMRLRISSTCICNFEFFCLLFRFYNRLPLHSNGGDLYIPLFMCAHHPTYCHYFIVEPGMRTEKECKKKCNQIKQNKKPANKKEAQKNAATLWFGPRRSAPVCMGINAGFVGFTFRWKWKTASFFFISIHLNVFCSVRFHRYSSSAVVVVSI